MSNNNEIAEQEPVQPDTYCRISAFRAYVLHLGANPRSTHASTLTTPGQVASVASHPSIDKGQEKQFGQDSVWSRGSTGVNLFRVAPRKENCGIKSQGQSNILGLW